jgi:hypothetical protein
MHNSMHMVASNVDSQCNPTPKPANLSHRLQHHRALFWRQHPFRFEKSPADDFDSLPARAQIGRPGSVVAPIYGAERMTMQPRSITCEYDLIGKRKIGSGVLSPQAMDGSSEFQRDCGTLDGVVHAMHNGSGTEIAI